MNNEPIRRTRRAPKPWPASRQNHRYRLDIRVQIAVAERNRPVILHARINDLSTGGVSVIVPRELEPGAPAMIGFRVRDEVVWFRSRLRHRSGFRCGFQFVEMNNEQKLLIRRLCYELPV